MKKSIFVFLYCMIFCVSGFASEQNIICSFSDFVKLVVTPIEQSYNNGEHYTVNVADRDIRAGRNKPMYYRTEITNFRYSYDIKKTDSIMNPYIGIIEMSNDKKVYKQYLSESEAMTGKNDLVRTIKNFNTRRFYYGYISGSWTLKEEEIITPVNLNGSKISAKLGLAVGAQEYEVMSCSDTVQISN